MSKTGCWTDFIGLWRKSGAQAVGKSRRPTKKARRTSFCSWDVGRAGSMLMCCKRQARGATRHAMIGLWKELMNLVWELPGEHCQWLKSARTRGSRQLTGACSTHGWLTDLDTWYTECWPISRSFSTDQPTLTSGGKMEIFGPFSRIFQRGPFLLVHLEGQMSD